MNYGGVIFPFYAATLDTVIEQFGGICVALIGAGAVLWGTHRSQAKQRGPRVYELQDEEKDALILQLQGENVQLRSERNAWREICRLNGWDRRHDPTLPPPEM